MSPAGLAGMLFGCLAQTFGTPLWLQSVKRLGSLSKPHHDTDIGGQDDDHGFGDLADIDRIGFFNVDNDRRSRRRTGDDDLWPPGWSGDMFRRRLGASTEL